MDESDSVGAAVHSNWNYNLKQKIVAIVRITIVFRVCDHLLIFLAKEINCTVSKNPFKLSMYFNFVIIV